MKVERGLEGNEKITTQKGTHYFSLSKKAALHGSHHALDYTTLFCKTVQECSVLHFRPVAFSHS